MVFDVLIPLNVLVLLLTQGFSTYDTYCLPHPGDYIVLDLVLSF